jgi:uncharacterized protein (DUF433 family)
MTQKIKIKARDAVRDIRSGMTDSELMEEYGLSAKGLQSLFSKLLETKAITHAEMNQRREIYHDTTIIQQIDAGDIVKDIRAGMTDSELMEKYQLSSEGLRFALQTLTDTKVIALDELYGASPTVHDTVFVENMRELPRHYLAIAVEIYESKHPRIRGMLTNVTEKGIAATGMSARVGESKTLLIPAGDFIEADPILFEAECRWAREEKETGEWAAGFQITKISENCMEDLRRLIQALPFFD